jgi:hypothetical protein
MYVESKPHGNGIHGFGKLKKIKKLKLGLVINFFWFWSGLVRIGPELDLIFRN